VIYEDKKSGNEVWHDFDTSKDLAYYLAELRDSGYLVPEKVFPLLLDPQHLNITEIK
jgi:hypothetical protein